MAHGPGGASTAPSNKIRRMGQMAQPQCRAGRYTSPAATAPCWAVRPGGLRTRAYAELSAANQQDLYVLYATALSHQGNGDAAKATELAGRAAGVNTLPTLSYAFDRAKTKRML